jgi:3D (Asp-Asp-Asp) domain-containing protein
MFISQSIVRKMVVTLGAAVGFVFVYETTIRDSRYAARQAIVAEAAPRPNVGTPLGFTATAYCKGETTASGVVVRTGIAAADPSLLPVGSVVRVETPNPQYDGIWTIMDTGPGVQGRTLDLYMWNCNDALKFGRRSVRVDVLRLGWNPQNSEPSEVDALFRKREKDKAEMPIPAKPLDPTGVLLAPVALPPPQS